MPLNEALEFKKILLRLVSDYEQRVKAMATFKGETSEEDVWLGKTFARLTAEGSVAEFGGAYKLTPAGYSRYADAVEALRAENNPSKVESSVSSDLSTPLLYRLLVDLGRLRHLPVLQISTRSFEKLVQRPGEQQPEERTRYINRHLDYLEETGYVRIGRKAHEQVYFLISLTALGQRFVQPELAEFGQQPMLPQVVKSLEDEIQVLTYPQEEKDGMLYRLREAVAKQAPDVIAKVIVEAGLMIMKAAV